MGSRQEQLENSPGAAHLARIFPDGPPVSIGEQEVLAEAEGAELGSGPRLRRGQYADRMRAEAEQRRQERGEDLSVLTLLPELPELPRQPAPGRVGHGEGKGRGRRRAGSGQQRGGQDQDIEVEQEASQIRVEEVLVEEEEDAEDDGERLKLADRGRPSMPGPRVVVEGESNWKAIHRLGAWKSFQVQFPMLEEVPQQHRMAWKHAWVESLSRWREAESEEDKDTALLWLGFWAQGLLRKPHRGGRQGRIDVAYRFQCVQEGNWGGLVNMWERDLERRTVSLETMRKMRETEDPVKKNVREKSRVVREVVSLVGSCQLGKAMRRAISFGLADIEDPKVQEQLKQKFPQRCRPLPASVPLLAPIDSMADIQASLLELEACKNPGAGGLRNEYLKCLGETLEAGEVKMLEELGLAYTASQLPG